MKSAPLAVFALLVAGAAGHAQPAGEAVNKGLDACVEAARVADGACSKEDDPTQRLICIKKAGADQLDCLERALTATSDGTATAENGAAPPAPAPTDAPATAGITPPAQPPVAEVSAPVIAKEAPTQTAQENSGKENSSKDNPSKDSSSKDNSADATPPTTTPPTIAPANVTPANLTPANLSPAKDNPPPVSAAAAATPEPAAKDAAAPAQQAAQTKAEAAAKPDVTTGTTAAAANPPEKTPTPAPETTAAVAAEPSPPVLASTSPTTVAVVTPPQPAAPQPESAAATLLADPPANDETPKMEASKIEALETPKIAAAPESAEQSPKTPPVPVASEDAPKTDTPKAETPKTEASKTEAPKTETTKSEATKSDTAATGTTTADTKIVVAAPAKPPEQAWVVSEISSPIDYTPLLTATIRPTPAAADGPGSLTIRCHAGRTALSIRANGTWKAPRDGLAVTTQVDDQPAVAQKWKLSGDARTATSADLAGDFLKSLPDGGQLKIGITDGDGSHQDATYVLAGLDAVRTRLDKACGEQAMAKAAAETGKAAAGADPRRSRRARYADRYHGRR